MKSTISITEKHESSLNMNACVGYFLHWFVMKSFMAVSSGRFRAMVNRTALSTDE
jgi:hypothetical protein